MDFALFFIFFITAVFLVIVLFAHRTARREGTSTGEEFVGICFSALERTDKKERNKAKILKMLKKRSELSNSDIRKAVKVTRSSVVRYMNELEKEGKVKQVGKVGQSVVYRLNKPKN